MRAWRPVRIGAITVLLLGLPAGCALGSRPRPVAEPARLASASASPFVGDRECARCHAKEFEQHAHTNHARTLRPMRRDRLPAGFPATGQLADPLSGTAYTVTEADRGFRMAVAGPGGTAVRTVDLALGSGKRGMTFLAVDSPQALTELRVSCFPRRRQWFVTPGQGGPAPPPVGKVHEGEAARRCIGCHTVALPASGVVPEERFMGVGCESCHGPGKAHVDAAAFEPKPGAIESLRGLGATRLNELCGKCHRTAGDIDLENEVAAQQTQRFQPYGLMKSECFQRSGDRLSCVTCHAPHQNVETRPAAYERACLSCHGSGPKAGQSSTLCPVNPRSGCVGCHMPQRPLMPGISMADHYIRVFPGTERDPKGGDAPF